jgi:Asp-tRNA(Asn)/Glu-tRNA(Gln) amidotransferase C subunit
VKINVEPIAEHAIIENTESEEEVIPEVVSEEVQAEITQSTEIEGLNELQLESLTKLLESIESSSILKEDTENESTIQQEILKINSKRKHGKIKNFIKEQTKFLAQYVVVSSIVFFILL